MNTFTHSLLTRMNQISGQLGPVTRLLDGLLSLVALQAVAVACTSNDACYMGSYTLTACHVDSSSIGHRTVYEYQTQYWYYDSASGSGGWYCDAPVCKAFGECHR